MRVYTDGACSGNPGPGGWAWIAEDGRQGCGHVEHTTNQQMELRAALEAVRAVPGPLVIVSDSTYVVNCFHQKWYEGWRARGWKNAAKKPVANRDLWEPLIDEVLARGDEITFEWVKGHSGDPLNEQVDQLAVACAKQNAAPDQGSSERRGQNRDDSLGQQGQGHDPSGPEVPWLPATAIWVTGVGEPSADDLAALDRILDGLNPRRDLLVSGLRRGIELDAAQRAVGRGVAIATVLPYDDPVGHWPTADQDRFHHLRQRADFDVVLAGDRRQPGQAVAARNTWIQQSVEGAIVIGDPALARTLDASGLTVITDGDVVN